MIRARLINGGLVLLAIVAAVVMIRRGGEASGAANVTRQVERQHSDRIAEARADERASADIGASIEQHVSRADDLSTAAVLATIKDLRDAIDTVPPAVAGDPLPAAPVDRVRDALNAGIDRANRAAGAAAPAG